MGFHTGVNDQLHCIYGTYDIFHSIFCKWKQNKYRYTYWAGWSPVLYRQPSPNHHNRRNRQHRTPSLCYCEHRNINRRVCINIFQHNISFINRQVQATLVFENKSYPKHFFLNSCKFEDRNLINLHLILNSITQPCPMYYIHVIDNPFFTQKSIETHFE